LTNVTGIYLPGHAVPFQRILLETGHTELSELFVSESICLRPVFETWQWSLPLFLSRADVMKFRSLHCQLDCWKKEKSGY
jgi:hypothetical protein